MRNITKNCNRKRGNLPKALSMNRNRKGDISITILVIGVLLACSYALASFYLYDNKVKKGILESSIVEKMNSEIEKYNFYKNTGSFTDEEIGNFLGVQTDVLGKKYLYVEKMDNSKKIIFIKYYLS